MQSLRLCLPALLLVPFTAAQAQSPNIYCVASATPPVVRAEGLTERIGDIALNCSGQPNAATVLNLTVTLNANVTNRLSTGNTLSGIVFTIDNGAGPRAVTIAPTLGGPNQLVYNGVNLALSSSGAATLLIQDIRANAAQAPGNQLLAFVGVNGTSLLLTSATLTVGNPQLSLYSSQSSQLVCDQSGAALPSTISFSSLISSGAIFASTRVTEGFADAFQPRTGWANLNADTGTRILVRYTGFPQNAQLFAPDVVAGSDAAQATAGGDFGIPAAGGAYAPSQSGSLLLARVAGADSNGAGGAPVYAPGLPGSATVQFNTVSQLQIANGAAYAVYEVVDADPSRIESAQFPTFLGLAPSSVAGSVVTGENVSLAPLSTVSIATMSDPIPRFMAVAPLPDCSIVGDCSASYLPRLSVQNTPFQYAAVGGRLRCQLSLHSQHRLGRYAVERDGVVSARSSFRLACHRAGARHRQRHGSRGRQCRQPATRNLYGYSHGGWRPACWIANDPGQLQRRRRAAPARSASSGCQRGKRRQLRERAGCSRLPFLDHGIRARRQIRLRHIRFAAGPSPLRQQRAD